MVTFGMKLKYTYYKSHWNILVFFDQRKMMPNLNISHVKLSDFVSFPFFGFTLVIKLKHLDFQSRWNNLIFIVKKDGKMSGFVSFSLFGSALVMKLRKFDFESHWNTLIFFHWKKIWFQIWIWPKEECLILFSFHFLFISFHFISLHFIAFHSISFHFISFHFNFISFHFISFHFSVIDSTRHWLSLSNLSLKKH